MHTAIKRRCCRCCCWIWALLFPLLFLPGPGRGRLDLGSRKEEGRAGSAHTGCCWIWTLLAAVPELLCCQGEGGAQQLLEGENCRRRAVRDGGLRGKDPACCCWLTVAVHRREERPAGETRVLWRRSGRVGAAANGEGRWDTRPMGANLVQNCGKEQGEGKYGGCCGEEK